MSVFNKVCDSYPTALFDEVTAHWQDHLARNVSEAASGAVFGYLACRVPRVAAVVAAAGGAQSAFAAFQRTAFLCDRAYNADTDQAQSSVASAITQDAVEQSLHTMPTLVGLGGGFGVGRFASKRASEFAASNWTHDDPLNSTLLRKFATIPYEVRNAVSAVRTDIFPVWRGPGSDQLPMEFKSPDGTHNLMGITKWLADRHPWEGHEVSRFVRKSDLRASMFTEGTPISVTQPTYKNDDVFDFHIHPPGKASNSVPSSADQTVAKGLGIIQSGERTTLYVGRNDLMKELGVQDSAGYLHRGKYWFPNVHVVFDRQRRLAMEAHPEIEHDGLRGRRPLDYDELERRLTNFDGNWSTMRTVPTAVKSRASEDFLWSN